jgi:thiamine-phosphate pyrophosphorylase
VRVDSHAYSGYTVPPNYDSLIAKLIAVGATRGLGDRSDAAGAGRISDRWLQNHDPVSQSRSCATPIFATAITTPAFVDRIMNSESFDLRPPEGAFARVIAPAVKALAEARLYAILDLGYVALAEAQRVAIELLRGGADLIQLRGKKQSVAELTSLTNELHGLTSEVGVPLIINDHAEIAREIAVEGLHLGQDDLPIAAAREIVGRECWIGKSTHSLAQASAAAEEGADYIGFGPLFATPTKAQYQRLERATSVAFMSLYHCRSFALAESSSESAMVLSAGASRVVIVSGLLQSGDIATATRARNSCSIKIRNPQSAIRTNPCRCSSLDPSRSIRSRRRSKNTPTARRFRLLRCGRREFFFPGPTGRRGGRRFSRIGIRILEIAQDRRERRATVREKPFAGRANTPGT